MPSDPGLLVLHALRLTSAADDELVASRAGLPVAQARELLEKYCRAGWVRHREGSPSGWMLLPPGRAEGARLLAAELDGAGCRPLVDACYRRFLVLNRPLLEICTRWQLRNRDGVQIINDHTDQRYDDAVVAELRTLHAEALPIATELAIALDRFTPYGPRLTKALGEVEAGERDWFTRPTIDSYHTVWFELHEDLLATLGLDRSSEEAI